MRIAKLLAMNLWVIGLFSNVLFSQDLVSWDEIPWCGGKPPRVLSNEGPRAIDLMTEQGKKIRIFGIESNYSIKDRKYIFTLLTNPARVSDSEFRYNSYMVMRNGKSHVLDAIMPQKGLVKGKTKPLTLGRFLCNTSRITNKDFFTLKVYPKGNQNGCILPFVGLWDTDLK